MVQDIQLRSLEAVRLVGFRVLCEPDEYPSEIASAAREAERRAAEIPALLDSRRQVGAFVVDASDGERDGYWIGYQVDPATDTRVDVPVGMVELFVPAQTYAATMHSGSVRDIRSTYEAIHTWQLDHGLTRAADAWHLELFDTWHDPEAMSVELLDTVHPSGQAPSTRSR